MTPAGFLNAKDPAIQPDVFAQAGLKIAGRVHPKVFGEAHDLLLRIITLFEQQTPLHRLETSGLLLLLMANLVEGQTRLATSDTATQAVEKLAGLLQSEFHETLRSQRIKALTGYHPVHLARLFKKHTGLSPRQYQRRLKINRAKDLLRHSHLSLTAIAEQCGFSSLALFSRTFHQLEGLSPTEYLRGSNRK
jgi:transcriptional regulator GlxA family with amidase domain